MKPLRCLVIAVLLVVAPSVPGQIRGTTGEPTLDEGFSPTALSAKADYEDRFRWGLHDNPIEITRFPEGDTERTRYGILSTARYALTYRVEPNDDGTLQVVVDANADGDLTNDSLLELSEYAGPWHTDAWVVALPEAMLDDAGTPKIKLVVTADASTALVFDGTVREGIVRVGDRRIKFALHGHRGIYDEPFNRVYLDLDGDGEVPVGDLSYLGAYELNDQYLWIDGMRYRFLVEPDGSALNLWEAPTEETPPPPVHTGATAAPFSFVDMSGEPGSLDDYRGSFVLLYFWGTWCGPCLQTLPELEETYRRYRNHGLRVLAIAKRSKPDDVKALMEGKGLDWDHVLEDSANPIASLYRVRGVPDYVLIDARGTIVGRGNGFDLEAALDARLPGESTAD